MPFARISLIKGKSPEYVRAVADSVHNAMVAAFNVPADDRFQLIHQHAPDEMIFDSNYYSDNRSENFVLIHITIGKPRSTATKKATYKKIVELLQISPGIRPEDVMIVISKSQLDEWSFSMGLAQMALDDES